MMIPKRRLLTLLFACLNLIQSNKKDVAKIKSKNEKQKSRKCYAFIIHDFLSSTRNSMTTYLSTVVAVCHEMSQKRRGAFIRLIEAFTGVRLPLHTD